VISIPELNVPVVVKEVAAGTMTDVLKSTFMSYEITWQFVRSLTVTGIARGPPGVAITVGIITFRTSVPPPGFAHPTIKFPPGTATISALPTSLCARSRNAKREEPPMANAETVNTTPIKTAAVTKLLAVR